MAGSSLEQSIPDSPPSVPWYNALPSRPRTLAKAFFLLLTCAFFAFADGSDPMFFPLKIYTQGDFETPYQYRELMMYVFRALVHRHWIQRLSASQALQHDPYRLVFIIISLVAILGAFLANRLTLLHLTRDRVFSFWASFLVILMAHLLLASTWGPSLPVPYDVPALAFFALGIYLILRRRWLLYYPVFILAVFNRETACCLTIFLAAWTWVGMRERGVPIGARVRRIAPHVAVQAALWLAIKLYLAHKYALNPREVGLTGGLATLKLGYNIRELLKPFQWPLLASVCAFALPFVWLNRRFIGSRPFAWATLAVLAFSLPSLLLVGVVVEIRIFTDWIAMIAPCAALIVFHRFRPVAAVGRPEASSR